MELITTNLNCIGGALVQEVVALLSDTSKADKLASCIHLCIV